MDWRATTDVIMQTCRNTFGEAVTLQRRVGGGPIFLRGIFEEASNFQAIGTAVELEGFDAFIDFRSEDLSISIARDDMFKIDRIGKFFKVSKVEYDAFSRHRVWLREFLP